ncbi:MAG: response regulator, partial [Phascolarctobacterium sp.]
TVAVNKHKLDKLIYLSNNYPHWKIKEYDTDAECIEAVRKANVDVDCAVFNSYGINNIISPRNYEELQAVALNSEMELSLAVRPDNIMLLSILNRAIDLVPRADLNSSLSYFSTPNERQVSFSEFLKDNLWTVLFSVLLITIAIVGTVLVLFKRAKEAERQARIALQTAEHANRAKTTFLNSMSHDIRTPMNAIIGFTSLAAVHLDDKRLLENYLKKIMTSSNHLLSLINDVLDMSRIESGRIKIEENECNLPTVMHDLRNILQSDVKAKHLNFLFDTLDVRDDDVICDKLRLSQIILNCMSNAIKFTKPGGTVGIKIVQRESTKEGYALYDFIISDTGIGMSDEFQKHVFEPFTREETSTVSGIQGTGLGMSITKNIVDMMGGSISVKSVQGQGTEFTISLCLKTCHKQKKITVIRSLKGMRALVADDNMDSCVSVCRLLEKIGMTAEWTMSGTEAVYKAKFAHEDGKSFKAFIIDWLMPDMNGIEVVRRIRSVIGNDTPIIILTAYDWSEIEQEAREAGVTAFCAKPLFLSDLYEVLNNHIEVERKEPEPKPEAKEDFSHARILLVEDNDLNREIGRAMLQGFDVHVEEAENGKVAVQMVATSQPNYYDLVLMDIQMPVMNGYEAAREILALEREDVKNLPIVAVSANAFKEDMDKSLEAGMVAHLSKPFTKQMLEEILHKYLKK